MSLDTLEVFGTEYTNVAGFKAYDDNDQVKTYIRPDGTYTVSASGSGTDISTYASLTVPAGTAGTPSASKGTVSNHSISVTPSVTNQTGWITGNTKTGTAVTVSASELVSGSQTITTNQTIDVTNLAEIVVNVTGGMEYESGTYTPSADTARPTISFSKTHSTTPALVVMTDTSAASGITSNSNILFCYFDPYRLVGSGYPYSTSATRYAVAYYSYRGSNNASSSGVFVQYNSDNTSSSSTSYSRYWATASNFMPYSNSTSRYWRANRNYKWYAVWKP